MSTNASAPVVNATKVPPPTKNAEIKSGELQKRGETFIVIIIIVNDVRLRLVIPGLLEE